MGFNGFLLTIDGVITQWTWIVETRSLLLVQTVSLHVHDVHAHVTCVTRKQTLRSLSLSYQKKDGCACPSFGMTPTF